MLMRAGKLDKAREMIGRARRLDPASPLLGVLEARISYYSRQYERAREQLRAVLDREPTFALAHYYLALCQVYLGAAAEAEHEMGRAGLTGTAAAVELAWIRGRFGSPDLARRPLRARAGAWSMVFVAADSGLFDEAFALLERALSEKRRIVLAMRVDPRFDPLRTDPRYLELLRRTGME
jgi:serine/threonine-protein kinase